MVDIQEIEVGDFTYVVEPYQEGDDHINVLEVVVTDTGEVVTDQFFEDNPSSIGSKPVPDTKVFDELQEACRGSAIDDFLDKL